MPAIVPALFKCGSSVSICVLRSTPAPRPDPTHRAAPSELKDKNRIQPIRVAPASGDAMIDSPGTNFATRSAFEPHRSKRLCVWLTHESGVREIRHNTLMTLLPYTRPAMYQLVSAARHAATAPSNSSPAAMLFPEATAPATTHARIARSGPPI